MEERNRDRMMIPENCCVNGEISEGFGVKELLRSAIFLLVGGVIGFIIFLFNNQLVTIVFSAVCGGACGYIFCKKDRYSRVSIVDALIDLRKFIKSQKVYEYRRK